MSKNTCNPILPRDINREFNSILDGFLNPGRPRSSAESTRPENSNSALAMDISETNHVFRIVIDLPGVRLEEVDLALHEKTMEIKIQRTQDEDSDESNGSKDEATTQWFRRDRRPIVFEESLRFGTPLNGDAIDAKLELGVLTITLPKAEVAKPRTIRVS